ncbi:SDR family oxidoreductase [Paenisporosarcina cavernae]|uniref:SDR family oxidoreductase n=1 Tax=Paenisporosarcina cavernae TaxID=2320858 RepID=UPI001EE54A8C|nr:SDR family oxidoreductase [Paenisporosarcina cavernae]
MTYKPVAIVTGASHPNDIGAAICRKLASQGVDIFFTYFKADAHWKEQFVNELESMGVRCRGKEIDLSKPDAAKEVMVDAIDTLDIPTILINNAAHTINSDFMDLDVKTLDAHYAVNVRTTCLLSVEFARTLQTHGLKWGRIISLTSGQDIGPMPGNLAYVASKGALSAFTVSLSAELAPLGITVNAVNPGPTDSTWMTDEIRNHLLPKFLMGRIGTPEDCARMIGFLASEEAEWITGQVIHSEGGFLRG